MSAWFQFCRNDFKVPESKPLDEVKKVPKVPKPDKPLKAKVTRPQKEVDEVTEVPTKERPKPKCKGRPHGSKDSFKRITQLDNHLLKEEAEQEIKKLEEDTKQAEDPKRELTKQRRKLKILKDTITAKHNNVKTNSSRTATKMGIETDCSSREKLCSELDGERIDDMPEKQLREAESDGSSGSESN